MSVLLSKSFFDWLSPVSFNFVLLAVAPSERAELFTIVCNCVITVVSLYFSYKKYNTWKKSKR